MIAKKAVPRHQLYGPTRTTTTVPKESGRYVAAEHLTPPPPSRHKKNVYLLQSQPHSQSITALQNMDLYGSYTTLPTSYGGAARTPTTSTCPRHFNAPPQWYPSNRGSTYCLCHAASNHASQYTVSVCDRKATAAAAAAPCQHHASVLPPPCVHHEHHGHKAPSNICYFGYEHANHLTDEEDSAFPVLQDRELHLLHRNIPALRRTGVDTTGIRQYFYPDGGWGWIICGVSFLVHILTTGLQLSYGLLLFYAVEHLKTSSGIEWLGALSWSISMFVSPFVITFCRKRSTRLLAVVGGLVLPLGILFTSFATELGQIIFSYGIVFGVGVAMVRESSTIMLGSYFKRRRQFVEMVTMSGEGVGIALFSVLLKEGVGKAGWRFGLQIIAALVAISLFMAMLYRPASLYHPQRRAIQHLKNQRKKMRENKLLAGLPKQTSSKYLFLDISSLHSTTVKILLMTSAVAALGIYTPMFLMSLNAAKEGSDVQDLVLLQAFLGVSTVLGVVMAGLLIRRPIRIRTFVASTEIIAQVFISIVAIAILFLSFVMGYKGLCILSWIYGIGFGGFRYAFKILALERIKVKQFTKAWGLIKGVESIPVLISVPLTSFLNDYSLKYGRAGYYICSAATAIAGIIIFFINYSNMQQNSATAASKKYGNGLTPSLRSSTHHCKSQEHFVAEPMTDYIYNGGCDYPAPDLLNRSCVSLNQLEIDNEYRGSCCRRLRMQCCHKPPYDAFAPSGGGRMKHGHHIATEADITQPSGAQYNFGQGSIGARMGKRIQKSLSFIQNPYCCDGQWFCNCHQSLRWSYQPNPRSDMLQPLLCTCSPSSQLQSVRSRSVPEGLSTISDQCSCSQRVNAPSRDIIYLPRAATPARDPTCQHYNLKDIVLPRTPSTMPRYRQMRSQSLSKPPIHFVEQITTSV